MGISKHTYLFDGVYRVIANRFKRRYQINIDDFVESMVKVGTRAGQGITFWPADYLKLKSLLTQSPFFAHDNRMDFCEALAASQTQGEGYRELGVPSLHCQLSKVSCNIHLDSYGFVAIGPDGEKYFNPELVQHIADDLGMAKIVEWLEKRNSPLGEFVSRIHPILPNSSNRYTPAVGGRFVLKQGQGWSLSIDRTISVSLEKKTTANLEVLDW